MNRQTTYFLQKVLTGLASSIIYAAFDSYRYNNNSYNQPKRNFIKQSSYKSKPRTKSLQLEQVNTNFSRNNRYK